VASGDDQGAAVRGEVNDGPLADDPFLGNFTGADVPEPDPVGVPAATRRPAAVAAEGVDLAVLVYPQFPPHRAGLQVQDLVDLPLDRLRRPRAAFRAAGEPGPGQGGQLPRRAQAQTLPLRTLAGYRPAQQTVPTARQEVPGRGGGVGPGPLSLEEHEGGPGGQHGHLPAVAPGPQAGPPPPPPP